MKIEVACKKDDVTKQKGDLLEALAKKLLEAQGYEVTEELRIVGAELDLLCRHKVSGKTIYVECKATKDPTPAKDLRQLLGTIYSEDYSEGWLISTSGFTKDAKGFIENWKQKPLEKSSKLSFYSPDNIVNQLCAASIISKSPVSKAEGLVKGPEFLGDWTLLISTFGYYWCVYTLQGGAPYGVLVFTSLNERQVEDELTLSNISELETALTEYDLKVGLRNAIKESSLPSNLPVVVEVQTGESWDDYRPARPQDFVGRESTQKDILSFLESAKQHHGSRIFAITGNSGLGKSSLIAKLRDRSANKFYKNKYFIYAVDVRGARSPAYILAAVIECFKKAQEKGFGDNIDLTLTNPTTPLGSPSIQTYFDSLDRREQVVCLVFDQFEELYSKPELFGIFKAAQSLMLEVAGFKRNFVLGFAWKTDSTTQQDHPAYHMWHSLSDHRREYRLEVFDTGEIASAITTFEKEINQKITPETRNQVIHSCQGFPWLLKKLCINLFEGLSKGEGAKSALVDLDARRLFESDLESLSPKENTCLRLIAQQAPADWSEVIESSGHTTLNSLVHKRLVVKSGDRLNIYWDIFKDYLLTGKVPIIPFNYIPTTDLTSMLKLCEKLPGDNYVNSSDLVSISSLKEKTIWNIGADLVMFGLAERDGTSFKLHPRIPFYNESDALKVLREKLNKHSLKLALYKKYPGKTIERVRVEEELKAFLPKATYGERTWSTYSNRMIKLLLYTGLIRQSGRFLAVQDLGAPPSNREKLVRKGKQRGKVFSLSVSPYSVIEAIEFLREGKIHDISRNSLSALRRFGLVSHTSENTDLNQEVFDKHGGTLEAVWSLAKHETSLMRCVEILRQEPKISGRDMGEYIAEEYSLNWSEGAKTRNGNVLRQWSLWLKEGIDTSNIPTPPGRPSKIRSD